MEFGKYRIEVVPDCEFRLDGGAMFGVVPRNLWSKFSQPDDQNRIRMNMNCLFLEAGNARHFISEAEYEHAESPTDRDKASYFSDNWRPLKDSGQLELKPAKYEVV